MADALAVSGGTIDLNGNKLNLTTGITAAKGAVVTLTNGTFSGGALEGKFEIVGGTFIGVDFDGVENPSASEFAIQGGRFDEATVFDKDAEGKLTPRISEDLYDADNVMFTKTNSSSGYYVLVPYNTLTFVTDNGVDPVSVKVPSDRTPSDVELPYVKVREKAYKETEKYGPIKGKM